MPVNAPAEYFAAEQKFKSAKAREDKIAALEEMIRLLPKHHGSESLHAQLKSRLAKLKKESAKKRGSRAESIAKEGECQICLVGYTNSGKSWLLRQLTNADVEVADYEYTTKKPAVGMMDYSGIKLQLVEIPATFEPRHISIARTSDVILLIVRSDSERIHLEKALRENFIRAPTIVANPRLEAPEHIRERIWSSLGLIIVKTRNGEPMALKRGATVRDFAERIHKDFVKDFKFARIWRPYGGSRRVMQAGLDYVLEDGDMIEVHTK